MPTILKFWLYNTQLSTYTYILYALLCLWTNARIIYRSSMRKCTRRCRLAFLGVFYRFPVWELQKKSAIIVEQHISHILEPQQPRINDISTAESLRFPLYPRSLSSQSHLI